ncbi:MAG: Fic family protein [Methylovulum sp.]|nr:Fic family protein [Methylovulum sp.]
MSKYQFQESDIYIPGTDIPKNRLGIDDPILLHEIEETLLQEAYRVFIGELNPSVCFDEHYFKSLHYRVFSALYDWAGEFRSVDICKGGSIFCLARNLVNASKKIFQELEREGFLKNMGSLDNQAFANRVAYYQCELIALHPFYELNGRITRLFFDLIAIYNGYAPIDYSHGLTNDKQGAANVYINASITCVQCADNRLLQELIFKGLSKM